MIENQYGRTSTLKFESSYKKGQTILKSAYFTPPFKIAKPLYRQEEEMQLIAMSASAGMMAGDNQEMIFEIGDYTNVYYTTQSYEKVHKMEQGEARRNLEIIVGEHALFKYVPLSTIPFAGSSFKGITTITLKDETSQLFMADIISAGRVAHQEIFEYDSYSSRVRIKQGEKLIYQDYTCYKPQEWQMKEYGIFEGYTHLANILIVNSQDEQENLERVRQMIEDNSLIYGGASLTAYHIICIKILGRSAQILEEFVARLLSEYDKEYHLSQKGEI